jgi:hypothetical protein
MIARNAQISDLGYVRFIGSAGNYTVPMLDPTPGTEPSTRLSTAKRIFLRAAGFGAGFAFVSVVLLVSLYWWNIRPKAWSITAITAKPEMPEFQVRGDEMHISLAYAFTNNTNVEYVVPSAGSGVLMRKVQETSSMAPIQRATWGTPTIPPHQSVDVTFDIAFELSDYGTSAADIDKEQPPPPDGVPKAELEFIQRRFNAMKDGLVFLDYSSKSHVDLPPVRGVTK